MSKLLLFVVAALIALLPIAASAQSPWVRVMDTLWVRGMCVLDASIFVSTENEGLFRSDDNGATWTLVSPGAPAPGGHGVAVVGDKIYWSNHSGGLVVSSDRGSHWTKLNVTEGMSHDYMETIVARGPYMLASGLFGASGSSLDYGQTWKAFPNNTDQRVFFTFFGDYTLCAFTDNGTVWRSSDQSRTWSVVDTVWNHEGWWWQTPSWARFGDTLLLTTDRTLYRSKDSGVTWQPVWQDTLQSATGLLTVIGSDLYKGRVSQVIRSRDHGQSWNAIDMSLPDGAGRQIIAISAANNYLFVASEMKGVYRMPLSDDPAPAAPQVVDTVAGNGWVKLTLAEPPGPRFLRYRAYGGTSPLPTVRIDSTADGVRDPLITVHGLTNETAYYVRVTAVDSSGMESPYSNQMVIKPRCCVGSVGDLDLSGRIDLTDLTILVSYETGAGAVLPCKEEANVDGKGIVDLTDLSVLVGYLTGQVFVSMPLCP